MSRRGAWLSAVGAVLFVLAIAAAGIYAIGSREVDPVARTSLVPPEPRSTEPPWDECVVGTWTEVSTVSDVRLFDQQVTLTYSGTEYAYSGDGGVTITYDKVTGRGTAGGRTYEVTHNGVLRVNWRSERGVLQYSNARGTGTTTWRIDGVERSSAPFSVLYEPERYTCTGDALKTSGTGYTTELKRTG